MTWDANTNTFNVTSVSSGTTSLTSANEGTNITISNGTINVGQVEDSIYKLPYTALKKPANKFIETVFQEPVANVPKVDIVGTEYKYMIFTHNGSTDSLTSYTVNFPET